MFAPNLSRRSIGALLLATAATVACAQSGTTSSSSFTAPSTLSSEAVKPGDSYNIAGSWHFIATDQRTGDVRTAFDADLTQDASGNASFVVPPGVVVTLTRHGNGPTITYKIAAFGATTVPCQVDLSGTAHVDTATNTGTGTLSGINGDCTNLRASLAFSKNP